jgi:hypothetical protein
MSNSPVIPRVWPESVRNQAWQLYAGPAKGNQSETARLLSTSLGETVPLSTVKGWAAADRWADRMMVESVDNTRELMDGYVVRLWVAVPTALSTISSIASGTLSGDPSDLDRRLRAATFIVDKAQQLLLKQADSSRRQSTGTRAQATVDLKSMTPEQLRTYEAELNRDR